MTKPAWLPRLSPALVAMACSGPTEAPRVDLPVVVDGSGVVQAHTALGYDVELTEARVAVRDLVFTVAGELHTAALWRRLPDALVAPAHAHPGHHQGGEVTGELPGAFVIDWLAYDGRELGVATLLAGTYHGANFTFSHAEAADLPDGDPLIGHTAWLSGTASKDGATVAFTIVVDSPVGRELVGAPFDATLDEEARGALHLRLETVDPSEGDTLFDDLDFAALDADGDGALHIGPDIAEVEGAYHAFRRTFQTHDHYTVRHEE